ncbi:MAG: beta-ACP synthase [Bacteroidales bacterium]|nr:beta-ACP synthase [Bacteroidales bacterium]
MAQRVVYLGKSAVRTAMGSSVKDIFDRASSGENGFCATESSLKAEKTRRAPDFATYPMALIDDSTVGVKASSDISRLEQLAEIVINEVVDCSNINKDACTLVFATTKGNVGVLGCDIPTPDSPTFLAETAERIARRTGFSTTPIIISNACISGVSATIVAYRMIASGECENAIVVGIDELTNFIVSGFMAFKSVSDEVCRPYDAARKGLSMGEAAAAILLTTDEKLSCGITIDGGCITNDANHISGPSRTGEPLANAINTAMREAGLDASDISFVNAHGTATAYNDDMESKAINIAGLGQTPINSLKPLFGHTLGASGVIEIAMAAEELLRGEILGTQRFETNGTAMPLNVAAENRTIDARHCVKCASGFGGCNAAVVLSTAAYHSVNNNYDNTNNINDIDEVASCQIANGKLVVDGKEILNCNTDFDTFIREIYHQKNEPNLKFFKMDRLSKLGYMGAQYVIGKSSAHAVYEPTDTAIILYNHASSLDTDVQHMRDLAKGEASPATFVYTLPNIVLGEIAISCGVRGETTFFVCANAREEAQVTAYAKYLLTSHRYRNVLFGKCELLGENYNLNIHLLTLKH